MNIIQQQDMARNATEQTLIDLASQPNPAILPPYLVTGELMRRKSIREKFAQAPQETVAEEVLTEAIQENQPQGIGALTNQMQAPMAAPQEEIMSESETISETGIANLPAPNIGQNYAGGGIIGFQPGGFVYDPYADGGKGGYYKAGLPAVQKAGLPAVTGAGAAAAAQPGFFKRLLTGAGKYVPGIVKRHPYIAGGLGLAGLVGLTGDDDEPELPPIAPLPESMFVKTDVDYTPEIDVSDMLVEDTGAYGDKMMEDHQRRMGVDPFAAKRQEKLAALEADIGGSDDALNMALIRGGLGMAGGTSDNFLTNLTAGLTTGVDAYVAEDDKQAQQQADLFALQSEIAAAERAEQVAIATTGTNSQATAEANNRKVQLKKAEIQLAQQQINASIATSSNNAAKQAQRVIGEIEELLNKNPLFATAAMDPKVKAQKDAARAEQYRIRGLDPTAINNLAMGLGGGGQSMYQGFSATEIVE
tara:strand:- start:50 stop:1474 length:1425 start_codon:yes stop_codon:yes gene_type:complete